MQSHSGLMTLGVGSLTDGKKRITLQVKCFSESALELGDCVLVTGNVKEQGYIVYKIKPDINFIIILKFIFY